MNFEEFREKLMDDLGGVLYTRTGEDYEIQATSVSKLQNAGYEGIVVRQTDNPVGLNLDAEAMFREYESGKRSYDEILDDAAGVAIRGFEGAPAFNVEEFKNYEIMKEKLSMQIVPTERNAELLENIPHREIEDMSVVCRFVVSNDMTGMGSILVTNDILKSMNVTEEQLFNDAMVYAPDLRPSEIKGMADVLAELMGVDLSEIEGQFGEVVSDSEIPMYVATTEDKTNGAGVIAYPGFMEMAAEKLQGDFFLLPSSLHEVILVPDTGDKDYHVLESMVQEINATEVAEKDRLSDHVYHYDAKEKIFELAEKFEARKSERTEEKDSVLKDLSAQKKEADASPKIKADKVHKKEEPAL
ncbi:hypothetical protein SAMN02910339_02953 [Lachnospiraceae bacterium YSD2013]|nr:hypothetical protein SAMN02910339_02953 [Lachnospiraceae bacterium YSD2013]